MKKTLIIAEKPSAAKKIAEAIADKKVTVKIQDKIKYYTVKNKDKEILVVCAVGHLYVLREINKKGWTYPVFDIGWVESYKASKKAEFTKSYLLLIEQLAKECDEFYLGTDKDLEGELIGYNILRFACKQKDAKRMEFSTMTKEDLLNAFDNPKPHVDFPLFESGETRHYLDFFYGISLSRALTLSIKKAGSFKLMSIGRVQGPTLDILAKKELEIKKFKPEPFWEIELITDKLSAFHKRGQIKDKKEAQEILKKTNNKPAIIESIKKTKKIQKPPYPFDLTSLQLESYKKLGFTPKQTLQLAQNLYIKGFISYPRTSSQKLPLSLGYKKILDKLSKQEKFSKLVKLLPEKLTPNEGPKSDTAHPAIFVTGEIGKLKPQEERLYDLIAHRFLATFGPDAVRETMSVDIDVNKEPFATSGTRTIEPGWHVLYGRFAKFEEQTLPDLKEKKELKVKEIKLHEKETQPPKRFTQASIIKELESKGLGTKATRSLILDTLYERNYVQERSIEVTDLGLKTVQTLKKYVPEILDEELTKHFEEELEQIQLKQKKPENILEEAKQFLTKSLNHFKESELKIGKELLEANRETQAQASLIGKCPNCEEGLLNLRRGRFGLFVSCDKYEKCGTTFSIPKGALIKSTKEVCGHCQHPKILIIKQGKRPMEICINKECPSKKSEIKLDKNKKCPKCGSELVIRKSIYASFVGCSTYPKCRYVEYANNNKIKQKAEPRHSRSQT